MATFMLRHIDEQLWNRFRARAAAEGLTTKQLLLRIIEAYVNS
jgi:plasmid stability protein